MSILPPIMNAVVAVTNAVGLTTPASAETKAARLAICQTCTAAGQGTCGLCGCVLTAKAAIQTERCPAGKWSC
jgi:hypothetical protein